MKLSGKICRALGGTPPEGFNYELFLDDKGQKISKSKGNGLTIEEWLTYASPESLSLFMFQKPTAAKRLYFDVIPRAVDDYLSFLDAYPRQPVKERLGNPVWHIHAGEPPAPETIRRRGSRRDRHLRHAAEPRRCGEQRGSAVLWGFLRRYAPDARPQTIRGSIGSFATPCVISAISCGRRKTIARPTRSSARRCASSRDMLAALPKHASAEAIQTALYDVARKIPRYQDLKAKGATPERPGVSNDWFNMLYAVLLGEGRGPRFGSFVALYGIAETRKLIADALNGDLIGSHAEFLAQR